ncbi:hypothetical protein BX616_004703, partial [Lobosporangium transversale]
IELLPIEFSHQIILDCIDEIKLRGLNREHLFWNPFYSPSVEAAIKLLMNQKKNHLFNVKMMRIDTVGGLLTTVLSRTYPPLIPEHLRELLQNPNGQFFFELLSMLPELNRFLFVEVLELCCELVDNQAFNRLSNSKLSIYPGSCCFGLDEYMPTWDTRYLLSSGMKKFSGAFYHAIYAYREERDLSVEELQEKQVKRDKLLAEQRLEALEREYGLEGAHNILKREARIAQGLPPDSPEPTPVPQLPADLKEISLYANRKEIVVADDNISILDMQLEDGSEGASTSAAEAMKPLSSSRSGTAAPHTLESASNEKKQEEEEKVEHIIEDLRRSLSVATLESLINRSSKPAAATTTTTTKTNYYSMSPYAPRTGYYSYTGRRIRPPVTSAGSKYAQQQPNNTSNDDTILRAKSIARFCSATKNIYPVAPGDIFGISRQAIERRELQGFLLVAQTTKKRRRCKSIKSKRIHQLRLRNKQSQQLHRRSSASMSSVISSGPMPSAAIYLPNGGMYRARNSSMIVAAHQHRRKHALASAGSQRRERTRRLRRELEVYLTQGLSDEEAMKQRKIDLKKRRKQEKRARAQALAEAAEAAKRAEQKVTMEEAEVLEAFDYLSDQELEEFLTLAGLTMQDVERIREKAAAIALRQVTKDIEGVESKPVVTVAAAVMSEASPGQQKSASVIPKITATDVDKTSEETSTAETIVISFGSGYEVSDVDNMANDNATSHRRPTSIPHMNSMDILLKNASMIGDSNLRCYPDQQLEQQQQEAIQKTSVSSLSPPISVTAAVQQAMVEKGQSHITNRVSVNFDVDVVADDDDDDDEEEEEEEEEEEKPPAMESRSSSAETLVTTKTIRTRPHLPPHERRSVESLASSTDTIVSPVQEDYVEMTEGGLFLQKVSSMKQAEDEEAAELRALLETMSAEERQEFLRLSS